MRRSYPAAGKWSCRRRLRKRRDADELVPIGSGELETRSYVPEPQTARENAAHEAAVDEQSCDGGDKHHHAEQPHHHASPVAEVEEPKVRLADDVGQRLTG